MEDQATIELSPVTRDGKDERRDAIIAIAKQAFIEFGYAGTSMSCIAARLGGSKATLYNYFKSKEELFDAVVGKKCEQFAAMLNTAAIESHGDLRAALTNFGEHFVELLLSDDAIAFHRLVIGECARVPEIGHSIYNAGVRQNHGRMAAFLTQAKETGQLRADADVNVAAEQFGDLCLAGIHRRRLWNVISNPSREDIRANVANAVSTFMRAFGA
ncbi:MAG TPA: TetR/AcrR family transcriptional regulator [Rhizomicrobium sp.]|nr:TetR/AcrR family transcriptional regulator [Rhizomicrobium sp.]